MTPKQIRAAVLVAGGSSDDEIANALKVNRSTVYRWRTFSPNFQAEANRHRSEIIGTLEDKLRDVAFLALHTLAHAMEHSSDDSVRIKAANSILARFPIANAVGPTDPAEIARREAERRQALTPNHYDELQALANGCEGVQAYREKVWAELEAKANAEG